MQERNELQTNNIESNSTRNGQLKYTHHNTAPSRLILIKHIDGQAHIFDTVFVGLGHFRGQFYEPDGCLTLPKKTLMRTLLTFRNC